MMRRAALSVSLVLTMACDREPPALPAVGVAVHRDSIESWHAWRQNFIYGPTGWATLVGLWWMKPGETTIGADLENRIALPRERSPKTLGSIWIAGDSARFVAAPGVRATVDTNKEPVQQVRLRSDLEPKATTVRVGPLVLYYIVRNGQHGVRIKDTLNPIRKSAAPLRYFPIDGAWRVQARFVKSPKPDSMSIMSVLGMETRMAHPGDLHFSLRGQRYSLMAIREPEDHGRDVFVMFTDSTNRKETYPSMRYVWVSPPDSLDRTVIDFNKAFNPPCAFTTFATCPFPPRGNALPLRVEAGEWNPHYDAKEKQPRP